MKCTSGHRLNFLEEDQGWAHPESTAWCSANLETEMTLREWLGERLDIILNAIDRLQPDDDAVFKEVQTATYERGVAAGRASAGGAQMAHINAAYDRGVAAGRASIQEATSGDQRHLMKEQFDRGVTIGKSEREAELLDAGWTPPGAITHRPFLSIDAEDEVEVGTGPTDYEVWRDAVLAAAAVTPDLTVLSPSGDIHVHQGSQLLLRAGFFRDHLKNYPTDIPELDPADQAQETRAAANPRDLEDPAGMGYYI